MNPEELALSQVEGQLRARGYDVSRIPRNSPNGDLLAQRNTRQARVEVKGLASRNGVWLSRRQVEAVDVIVIYVVAEENVWVLSPQEAFSLLDTYQTDFLERQGRPPAQEGFNKGQFPAPTGWAPLDNMLGPVVIG